MGQTPKNPNVERVRDIPYEKDGVMPVPQVATRLHAQPRRAHEVVGPGHEAVTPADDVTPPASGAVPPDGREEYPGPQTAPSGDHIEPGETRPAR